MRKRRSSLRGIEKHPTSSEITMKKHFARLSTHLDFNIHAMTLYFNHIYSIYRLIIALAISCSFHLTSSLDFILILFHLRFSSSFSCSAAIESVNIEAITVTAKNVGG